MLMRAHRITIGLHSKTDIENGPCTIDSKEYLLLADTVDPLHKRVLDTIRDALVELRKTPEWNEADILNVEIEVE